MPSEIEKRNCAVITLMPSYQAFTRPIYTVRFFRLLLIALLGQNPKTASDKSIFDFFFNNLYWTHYSKCISNSGNLNDVSDVCYKEKQYISKELAIVKPKLKVIVGDITHKRILQSELVGDISRNGIKFGAECISMNFPDFKHGDKYKSVRQEISKYVKGIDTKKIDRIDELSKKLTEIKSRKKIHRIAELDYLKNLLRYIENSNKFEKITSISFYRESIYHSIYYSFIMEVYSTLEQNLKLEAKERGIKLGKEDTIADIYKNIHGGVLEARKKKIHSNIFKIKNIRNCIAHRNGYIGLERGDSTLNDIFKALDGEFASYKINYITFSLKQCEKWITFIEDVFES